MKIDLLFVEAAIEKYSMKIGGIVVKTFENTSKSITKKRSFSKVFKKDFNYKTRT